jgi:hypothetical protein
LSAKTLFNGLLGMSAVDGAVGQVGGTVDRGWCDRGGQDKAVVGVNGRMLIKAVVGVSF